MNKYFIEFVGVLIILFAKVLTEAEPVVMGVVYFSVFHIAKGITSGYFNPLSALAVYGLGRTSFSDMLNNILAQGTGLVAFLIAYTPIHKLIKDWEMLIDPTPKLVATATLSITEISGLRS